MKKVFKNGILLAMMITVAISGCKTKADVDGKCEGTLVINGKSYSITESCMCVKTDGTVSFIVFQNKDGGVVYVNFAPAVQLTSKTYTANEIEVVGFPVFGESEVDFDEDNVEMAVSVSGKTYDISIIGKTNENEYEYTMTYKGKIRAEKNLCNH